MSDSQLQGEPADSHEGNDARATSVGEDASSLSDWAHHFDAECRARPTGFVRPASERAARALAALDDGRLNDAEKHVAALPDSPVGDHAWKLQLGGLLAGAREDSAAALPLFLKAASTALIEGYGRLGCGDAYAMRLAAWAFEQAGKFYRRQDRPDEAERAHLTAIRLRNEHGSFEEVWESAVSLGLDADLARRFGDAAGWHRVAIEAGFRAAEQPAGKQAVARTHLSNTLISDGRFEDAVVAARAARDLWRRHDLGAVTAARADLNLGHALLKLGESLHGKDAAQAGAVLNEALKWLNGAQEALLAFGPDHAADANWCREQADFAQRLIDSLDPLQSVI